MSKSHWKPIADLSFTNLVSYFRNGGQKYNTVFPFDTTEYRQKPKSFGPKPKSNPADFKFESLVSYFRNTQSGYNTVFPLDGSSYMKKRRRDRRMLKGRSLWEYSLIGTLTK